MTRGELLSHIILVMNNDYDAVRALKENDAKQRAEIERLQEVLRGIIEIGKRDLTNPKYDGYFEAAREVLKETP